MKQLFSKKYWADKDVERMIGVVLRYGIILSGIVVIGGGGIYLVRHGREIPEYRAFAGPNERWDNLPAIVHGALQGHGREIIQLGVVMLIATPIARILFSAVAFALEKDRLYVVITLIVLAIISLSMFTGVAG